MAAGCGDWDRIEASWPLSRVQAMRTHWRANGPPAHVSLAALAGFRPPPAPDQPIASPEDAIAQLRAMGLMG